MSYLLKRLSRLPREKGWLYNRIEQIKISPDGAKRWLKDLGKNDFEHAEAVEDYLDTILFESKVKLSPEEIYLLLHSIYTHDIGYRKNSENHAKHTYEMIIHHPEEFFIYDQNLADAIALICLAHGTIPLSEIPCNFPIDFLDKKAEFDLRFLGSLLRLSDDIDQGYLRVFNRLGQQKSPRTNIYHIEIGTQIIKLKTKPTSRHEWEELRKIRDYIQTRLEGLTDVLSKRGVKTELIYLYPTIWAEGPPHSELKEKKLTQISALDVKTVLFLLDNTVLSSQILQDFKIKCKSTVVVPMYYEPIKKSPPLMQQYSEIVLFLGEGFFTPIHEWLVEKIIQNTENGGGLVLFPFIAWSVSQGINDKIEELLPVNFTGEWFEGRRHEISKFTKHSITNNIDPFAIENTYELLELKPGAQCLISGSNNNPFLIIGSYGKGRVAYLNTCMHLCSDYRVKAMEKNIDDLPDIMISPWQQSTALRDIIIRTLEWAYKE